MSRNGVSAGSIGIGAMIVFIGLILVAAVASTVIIRTIEDLREDSDRTSDDTRNSVNNRVWLKSSYLAFNGESACTATLYQQDLEDGLRPILLVIIRVTTSWIRIMMVLTRQ